MTINIQALTPSQVVLNLALSNKASLEKVSEQISSGYKHDSFQGYAEDATTENFISFSSTLTSITGNISSNTLALSRAKSADSSISLIQGYANDLAALITKKNNAASSAQVPIASQAKGMLDNIAGALNINFDGRFLFAGSRTDTKPVQNVQASNIDYSGSTPSSTASYYQGDNDIPSVKSIDSIDVPYGILANDKSFQDLIAAAHLAIKAESENSKVELNQALDMVNNAINELASIRAVGNIAIDNLNKNNKSLQNAKLITQGNLNALSQTDIVQATAQMSSLQAIVQAGYLAYSRMSSLQLSNYLK